MRPLRRRGLQVLKRAAALLRQARFDALHRRLATGAAAAVVAACSPPAPAPSADAGHASRIFVGGPIVTVDAARPYAEAVALRDGRIVAVGKRTEVLKLMGPSTEVVDLKGRTLWGVAARLQDGRQASIGDGPLAELLILSDNPLTVDPTQSGQIVVLETIKQGRTVYRR